ncbi:transglutaminase domain-containing protein [Paenibacillus mendelii]|uniref:Transglutaminase domain-containing protein n=1 Tax=Paenibacillus mendelii TaxID=206163 RepID=A0ABV6JIR5_9BACL|nr:transglutaminase-like domain-containing protein [Paenibacillus mendelii]MCQ6558736.1 transglutaminase-like domain-containing protein [Paenibacillus mendelii]
MNTWFGALLKPEPVALMVLLFLLGSLIQGLRRGASGSAKHLFFFVWETVTAVISLILASKLASLLSPITRDWLIAREIMVPNEQLGNLKQLWYTLVTSLRDFELLRFGLLFLLGYLLLRFALSWLYPLGGMLFDRIEGGERRYESTRNNGQAASRATGAALGALMGAGRAFIAIAILFVYVTLLPDAPLTDSIRASAFYNKTTDELLEPVAGDVLAKRGPVFTEAVQAEFRRVLQRKYEVIDAAVPKDIEQAAVAVVRNADTDKEKAKALYDWLGSRIAYDWDKARNYEQRGEWKEQTPAETFETRRGVCIDTARLYAVMARSAGLEVKVVTGLGADGRGGYGPHAWNEVRLADQGGEWIPLDATWASSGNWFNSDGFSQTHIKET